jgi:hypothetical protein
MEVNAQVAAIRSMAHMHVSAGVELLLDYGGADFWESTYVAEDHCAFCFSRRSDDANPLVQCHGSISHGKHCSISRHRLCFPSTSIPSLEDLGDDNVHYYCSDHINCGNDSAAHSPERIPRALMQQDCTPPPRFSRSAASAHGESQPQSTTSSAPLAAAAAAPRDCCTPDPPIPAIAPRSAAAAAPIISAAQWDCCTPPPPIPPMSAPRSANSVLTARSLNFAEPDSAAQRNRLPLRLPASVSRAAPMPTDHIAYSRADASLTMSKCADDGEESDGWHSDGRSGSSTDTPTDDEECAVTPSIAAQEDTPDQSELDVLLRAAGHRSGVSHKRYAPMRIREEKETIKLKHYNMHKAPFTNLQLQAMRQVLSTHSSRTLKRRPWFIPRDYHRQLFEESSADSPEPVQSSQRSAASAPTRLQESALLNRHVARSAAASAASVASCPDGAEERPVAPVTSQRWRMFGAPLQHDWAEYRSCCGAVVAAGLSEQQITDHISLHSPNFFAGRLKFLAEFATQQDFTMRVRQLLREQVGNRIPWPGGDLCLSCFRALLGRGRKFMFRARHLLDQQEQLRCPKLTKHSKMRTERPAVKRERVINLLRDWSMAVGHSPPNPKTKDANAVVKFLPVKQLQELADYLSDWERTRLGSSEAERVRVELHTIKSARRWLRKHEHLHLTLGTSISLMRCAVCDCLDNQVKPAYIREHKRTDEQVLTDRHAKVMHLAAMQKQRDFANSQKEAATRHPERVWSIMIDGMDQSKTQLPHRQRYSKDLEPLYRMKVHAEGGFCFGGPQPVLGMLNFPDLRKDSNLCVLTVERILNVQWERLQQHLDQKRAAAAAAEAAAAERDPAIRQLLDDAARAAHTEDGKYAADGIGMSWPQRVHLTFDNAAGECKNQWMFRFLGLLVLHSIVHQITVSTLLVGHTHDIVDQLFSIWARMLCVNDAETYEKMRALFRDRYVTHIEGLVSLFNQRQAELSGTFPAAADAPPSMDALSEDQEWSAESAKVLQEFTVHAKKAAAELTPHIELQSVAIDVQGWMHRMKCKLPPLNNITAAHNFAIEKDEAGDVYLFNKFLCDSTEQKATHDGRPIKHSYPLQQTGAYTTRALLFLSTDRQHADPYKIPPLTVETQKLRQTADKFLAAAAMQLDERRQFEAMLVRLESAQAEQRTACAECADLAAVYCGHGVIHRHKGADEVELKATRSKSSAKQKAWDRMLAHLSDPSFADQHNAKQTYAGWWTKWLQRAQEHIVPAYIKRGVMLDPAKASKRYYDHPAHLVSGAGEPQVMDRLGLRVDVTWLIEHGIPRPGQMVLLRSDQPLEPFFVAEIVSVRGLDAAARAEVARLDALDATEAAVTEAAAAASGSDAAVEGVAAAAASPSRGHAAARSRDRLEPAKYDFSLKSLELTVTYWDLAPNDYHKTMHFVADNASTTKKNHAAKWWAAELSKHRTTMEQLQRQLQESQQADKLARPPWLLDMYKRCSFINQENMTHNKVATGEEQFRAQPERSQAPVNGSVLILWGKYVDLFNQSQKVPSSRQGKSWKLKQGVYVAAEKDLTQDWVPDADGEEPAAPEAAAAAAAAADVPEPMDMEEAACEEHGVQEEHRQQDRVEPAPARALQPHRACAARKRKIVDAGSSSDCSDDDVVLQSDDEDANERNFGSDDNAMQQEESEREAEESADEDMKPRSAPIPSTCTAAAGRCATAARRTARPHRDSTIGAAHREARTPARMAKRARRGRQ